MGESEFDRLAYAAACVLVPALWGWVIASATRALDRLRRGAGAADEPTGPEYHI